MGTSLYNNIGPFIVISGKKKMKDVVTIKRYCPTHPNDEQSNAKYCSKCGSEILNRDVTNKEEQFAENVANSDDLWSPPFEDRILISHESAPGDFKDTMERGGFFDFTDKQETMEDQLLWFKERFSTEIQKLSEVFGEENVHICWGIVQYYS